MSDAGDIGEVDWAKLATSLGAIDDKGREYGSSKTAGEAIEHLIGLHILCSAVDHYVAHKQGAELARHVLWRLHPWCAMQRCYEIYQNAENSDARSTAIELLRVVADRRALPWIRGFLEDPDDAIQIWGAGVLDQLLFSSLVDPEECDELLSLMATHPNEEVRKTHSFVQEYLTARQESE